MGVNDPDELDELERDDNGLDDRGLDDRGLDDNTGKALSELDDELNLGLGGSLERVANDDLTL